MMLSVSISYFLPYEIYIEFWFYCLLILTLFLFVRSCLIYNVSLNTFFVLDVEGRLDWDEVEFGIFSRFYSMVGWLKFILDWGEGSGLVGVIKMCCFASVLGSGFILGICWRIFYGIYFRLRYEFFFFLRWGELWVVFAWFQLSVVFFFCSCFGNFGRLVLVALVVRWGLYLSCWLLLLTLLSLCTTLMWVLIFYISSIFFFIYLLYFFIYLLYFFIYLLYFTFMVSLSLLYTLQVLQRAEWFLWQFEHLVSLSGSFWQKRICVWRSLQVGPTIFVKSKVN